MPNFSRVMKALSVAMVFTVATPLFADPAPVYDADSLPQQFDSSPDQGPAPADAAQTPAPKQNARDENVGQDDMDDQGGFVAAPAAQNPPHPQQKNTPVIPPKDNDSANNASNGFVPATSTMTIEERMARVEQQLSNMQGNDNAARLDALQNQVQALTGQVEQLMHQFEQMQLQQKNMASAPTVTSAANSAGAEVALNKLSKAAAAHKPAKAASSADAPPSTAATTAAKNQPNVAEEQQIYQSAYNYIKAKQYNEAVNTLQTMLRKYPQGQFASNAHYWLGELYGLLDKNDQALKEFSEVVSSYPDSPRVSDAQLKVGLILASQSRWGDAKGAFKKVINRYPGTASSRLAAEQLKQLKQAGH